MNNNLRFPISEIAQELYEKMVLFAKSANTNYDQQEGDITYIDEPNKYELRFNNYQKYLKILKIKRSNKLPLLRTRIINLLIILLIFLNKMGLLLFK